MSFPANSSSSPYPSNSISSEEEYLDFFNVQTPPHPIDDTMFQKPQTPAEVQQDNLDHDDVFDLSWLEDNSNISNEVELAAHDASDGGHSMSVNSIFPEHEFQDFIETQNPPQSQLQHQPFVQGQGQQVLFEDNYMMSLPQPQLQSNAVNQVLRNSVGVVQHPPQAQYFHQPQQLFRGNGHHPMQFIQVFPAPPTIVQQQPIVRQRVGRPKRLHVQAQERRPRWPYAKPRIRWTQDLHERFNQAVRELGGIFNAKPKAITDKMNTPWLTQENIKSHLQKMRIRSTEMGQQFSMNGEGEGGIQHQEPPLLADSTMPDISSQQQLPAISAQDMPLPTFSLMDVESLPVDNLFDNLTYQDGESSTPHHDQDDQELPKDFFDGL